MRWFRPSYSETAQVFHLGDAPEGGGIWSLAAGHDKFDLGHTVDPGRTEVGA